MLGTYGDGGNASVLLRRLAWRGIPAEHLIVEPDGTVPASGDIYLLGGGEDAAQLRALQLLRTGALSRAVDDGAACLAVCAGLQLLGVRLPSSNGPVAGLGVLDLVTVSGDPRLVGEIVVDPTALPIPALSGFENHAGRTTLGPQASPLGRVVVGEGNGVGGIDGAVAGSVVGTYLHGPVLARNPSLADWLLGRVLGEPLLALPMNEVDLLRTERLDAACDRSLAPRLLHRFGRRLSKAGRVKSTQTPAKGDE